MADRDAASGVGEARVCGIGNDGPLFGRVVAQLDLERHARKRNGGQTSGPTMTSPGNLRGPLLLR